MKRPIALTAQVSLSLALVSLVGLAGCSTVPTAFSDAACGFQVDETRGEDYICKDFSPSTQAAIDTLANSSWGCGNPIVKENSIAMGVLGEASMSSSEYLSAPIEPIGEITYDVLTCNYDRATDQLVFDTRENSKFAIFESEKVVSEHYYDYAINLVKKVDELHVSPTVRLENGILYEDGQLQQLVETFGVFQEPIFIGDPLSWWEKYEGAPKVRAVVP